MARYRSYLIRWWTLAGGEQRIEIEAIQTGARTIVATPAAACGWLEAQSRPAAPNPAGDGPGAGAAATDGIRRGRRAMAQGRPTDEARQPAGRQGTGRQTEEDER